MDLYPERRPGDRASGRPTARQNGAGTAPFELVDLFGTQTKGWL